MAGMMPNEVSLSWSQNTDADFKEYRVCRSTTPGVTQESFLLLAADQSQFTTHLDWDTQLGQTYYYRVYVIDQAGQATGSNEVSITKVDAPPAAVTLNTPSNVTTNSLDLSWSSNWEMDFQKYEVHQSQTQNFTPDGNTLITTITQPWSPNHPVTALPSNQTFYFKAPGPHEHSWSEIITTPMDPGVYSYQVVAYMAAYDAQLLTEHGIQDRYCHWMDRHENYRAAKHLFVQSVAAEVGEEPADPSAGTPVHVTGTLAKDKGNTGPSQVSVLAYGPKFDLLTTGTATVAPNGTQGYTFECALTAHIQDIGQYRFVVEATRDNDPSTGKDAGKPCREGGLQAQDLARRSGYRQRQ